jgi:hypothetical protein
MLVVETFAYEIERPIVPESYFAIVIDIGVPEDDAAICVPWVPPRIMNLPSIEFPMATLV